MDEELPIDHYINWALAKSQLVELHQATLEALRVCDVAMVSGEYINASDELSARLISMVNLTNEQLEQLSSAYCQMARNVLICSQNIMVGEINNEPRDDT